MPRPAQPRLQRLLSRRQFYLQLLKIAAGKLWSGERHQAVFVSLMGGIGDLVNLFPSIERLSARHAIEMGTGAYPYRALVEHNPHVGRFYSPFVYKPTRQSHRRLIQRVLGLFYSRVILVDGDDGNWWARGKHISEIYAERCGCRPPEQGAIYLPAQSRASAAEYIRRQGFSEFIYVVQLIRARRTFRSWPLSHYQELLRRIHCRFGKPILVDTTGSDESAVEDFCQRMERLDILTAAAVIERARLFIGPDSGLTHIAGVLNVPTVSIHLGFPPESCRALGKNVLVVGQQRPFDDPARTSVEEVFHAVERALER